ncbi:MAG: hypothetical protein U0401_19515 [Anaerolineae bacterium]
MRYLLDKNIVRYAIAGLYFGRQRLLSSVERGALIFWRAAETNDVELFISHTSWQVLQTMTHYNEVRLFLDSVQVLYPTRYHRRWTRRIRETTGLTREDTAMIALGSFGTNVAGTILGVHGLVT